MAGHSVVDSHVHFWDPAELDYPWLDALPALRRPFGPAEYAAASAEAPVERVVFVECNPAPGQGVAEARRVQRLAEAEPRLAGIVAFADLLDLGSLVGVLDELSSLPLLRGVRHNIQGNPPGFCLQPAFVAGVLEVGRRGLSFDLCATHDQLGEVAELAARCPDTRLVLDHCGKPAIRDRAMEPWRDSIARLASLEHVWCKLSGLLTEADPARWSEDDLLPYADHIAAAFGTGRLMYGSDWPVLTLAGPYGAWYQFTRRFTRDWSPDEARRFYRDNAAEFYRL